MGLLVLLVERSAEEPSTFPHSVVQRAPFCRLDVGVSSKAMVSSKAKDDQIPPKVECLARSYVISFQSEPSHKGTRFHWMICGAQTPDELVSWGYASTQEQAETEAHKEVSDLSAGITQGGQVTSVVKPFTRR